VTFCRSKPHNLQLSLLLDLVPHNAAPGAPCVVIIMLLFITIVGFDGCTRSILLCNILGYPMPRPITEQVRRAKLIRHSVVGYNYDYYI